MLCKFKKCARCGGDLVLDEADWRCVQCAQYYYVRLDSPGREGDVAGEPTGAGSPDLMLEYPTLSTAPQPERRAGPLGRRSSIRKPRSMRNINSVIEANSAGEAKWHALNSEVIRYLDQGLSVLEIARLASRGQRQIRIVRERLAELRAAGWVPRESKD